MTNQLSQETLSIDMDEGAKKVFYNTNETYEQFRVKEIKRLEKECPAFKVTLEPSKWYKSDRWGNI